MEGEESETAATKATVKEEAKLPSSKTVSMEGESESEPAASKPTVKEEARIPSSKTESEPPAPVIDDRVASTKAQPKSVESPLDSVPAQQTTPANKLETIRTLLKPPQISGKW